MSYNINNEEQNEQNKNTTEIKAEIPKTEQYPVLTVEQWNTIKPKVIISSYGNAAEFFPTIESMKKASKIVTLNGSPIHATSRKGTSMFERAKPNVVKLPNGQYAVLSDTLKKDCGFMGMSRAAQLPDGL